MYDFVKQNYGNFVFKFNMNQGNVPKIKKVKIFVMKWWLLANCIIEILMTCFSDISGKCYCKLFSKCCYTWNWPFN